MNNKPEKDWENDTLRMKPVSGEYKPEQRSDQMRRPIRHAESSEPEIRQRSASPAGYKKDENNKYIIALIIVITVIICLSVILLLMNVLSNDEQIPETDSITEEMKDSPEKDIPDYNTDSEIPVKKPEADAKPDEKEPDIKNEANEPENNKHDNNTNNADKTDDMQGTEPEAEKPDNNNSSAPDTNGNTDKNETTNTLPPTDNIQDGGTTGANQPAAANGNSADAPSSQSSTSTAVPDPTTE